MALQELDYRFTKRTIRKNPEGDGGQKIQPEEQRGADIQTASPHYKAT